MKARLVGFLALVLVSLNLGSAFGEVYHEVATQEEIGGNTHRPWNADSMSSYDYIKWFNRFYNKDAPLPKDVVDRVKDLHFVFIGHFLNESGARHYAPNRDEIVKLGIPDSQIDEIKFPSGDSIDHNSAKIARELEVVRKKYPKKKIVLLGYSKGASELLAAAMRNPHFVHDYVKAAFLMNGPVTGSGAADYLASGKNPLGLDSRTSDMDASYLWFSMHLTNKTMPYMGWDLSHGVSSMTHKEAAAMWAKIQAEHPESPALISDKIHYIVCVKDANQQPLGLAPIARYENLYDSPQNDGVVSEKDQMLPGVGTPLARLNAGHWDLTFDGNTSNEPAKLRTALMKSIFMVLGQPEGQCTPDYSGIARQPISHHGVNNVDAYGNFVPGSDN